MGAKPYNLGMGKRKAWERVCVGTHINQVQVGCTRCAALRSDVPTTWAAAVVKHGFRLAEQKLFHQTPDGHMGMRGTSTQEMENYIEDARGKGQARWTFCSWGNAVPIVSRIKATRSCSRAQAMLRGVVARVRTQK
ncbi:unnamed protein product [Sphagnum balticum]